MSNNSSCIISIIVATYNSASTVADTIESILDQKYRNFEVIVQDGNSTDNTLDIVRTFDDPRIKIFSEKDSGIYDAMNKGISHATGDIIGILNSDDFYAYNQVLSDVDQAFEKENPQCVYGDLHYVEKDNLARVVRKWVAKKYDINRWLYGWMPPHPTFYVRKEVYDKYGLFNLSLNSAADYEIMLRFLYKEKLAVSYINKTLVKMRTGGHSNASLKNRFLGNQEDRKAWKINNLKPYCFTLYLKPIRKIAQYL